jgi:hypothetical protein
MRVGLLGFDAMMQTCRLAPVFWKNFLHPSSELKKERGIPAIRTDKLKGWESNAEKSKAGKKVQNLLMNKKNYTQDQHQRLSLS